MHESRAYERLANLARLAATKLKLLGSFANYLQYTTALLRKLQLHADSVQHGLKKGCAFLQTHISS